MTDNDPTTVSADEALHLHASIFSAAFVIRRVVNGLSSMEAAAQALAIADRAIAAIIDRPVGTTR